MCFESVDTDSCILYRAPRTIVARDSALDIAAALGPVWPTTDQGPGEAQVSTDVSFTPRGKLTNAGFAYLLIMLSACPRFPAQPLGQDLSRISAPVRNGQGNMSVLPLSARVKTGNS
jgi:hypothetical protein